MNKRIVNLEDPSAPGNLAGLMTYLSNQGQRLAYDRFRRKGLDINSGRVEAMCKQVGFG